MASKRVTREACAPEIRIPLSDRREARALAVFTLVVWGVLVPLPLMGLVATKSPFALAMLAFFVVLAGLVSWAMGIDHRQRRLSELILDQKGVRLERAGRERWRARWVEVLGWRANDDDRRFGKVMILTRDGRTYAVPVEGGLQLDGRYDRVARSIGEFCDEIKPSPTVDRI